MLKRLVTAGVGLSSVEAFSWSVAGKAKWVNRGEVGRVQVVCEEMNSRVEDSNFKVSKFKKERSKITDKFKGMVSRNVFRINCQESYHFVKSRGKMPGRCTTTKCVD